MKVNFRARVVAQMRALSNRLFGEQYVQEGKPTAHPPIEIADTVICKLSGGLANQLICYKLGRYVADVKRYALILDASSYENLSATSNRNLQLHKFKIRFNSILFSSAILENIRANNEITDIRGPSFSDFSNPDVKQRALTEVSEAKSVLFCDIWAGLALREVADQHAYQTGVLTELTVDIEEHFTGENLLLLEQIRSAQNPVAVHVRRGDFATHDGGLLVAPSFYNEAMASLRDKLSEPDFFIFSDDIEWCKQNLKSKGMIRFVDINDERSAYLDLTLAASCKHFVLSNESTFSHQIWELSDENYRGIVIRSGLNSFEKSLENHRHQ